MKKCPVSADISDSDVYHKQRLEGAQPPRSSSGLSSEVFGYHQVSRLQLVERPCGWFGENFATVYLILERLEERLAQYLKILSSEAGKTLH